MYKFCYFVPESHLEQTKQALFDVGAGKIGEYDRWREAIRFWGSRGN